MREILEKLVTLSRARREVEAYQRWKGEGQARNGEAEASAEQFTREGQPSRVCFCRPTDLMD